MNENLNNKLAAMTDAIKGGDEQAYQAAYDEFAAEMMNGLKQTEEYKELDAIGQKGLRAKYKVLVKDQCDRIKNAYDAKAEDFQAVDCAEVMGENSVCAEFDQAVLKMAEDLGYVENPPVIEPEEQPVIPPVIEEE